jgi:hypothetical protein
VRSRRRTLATVEGRAAQVTNRMFLAEWLISVPACMGACAVFALNHEFLAVRREIKNGAYSPWAYLISNAIFQVGALADPPTRCKRKT